MTRYYVYEDLMDVYGLNRLAKHESYLYRKTNMGYKVSPPCLNVSNSEYKFVNRIEVLWYDYRYGQFCRESRKTPNYKLNKRRVTEKEFYEIADNFSNILKTMKELTN